MHIIGVNLKVIQQIVAEIHDAHFHEILYRIIERNFDVTFDLDL